MTFRTPSKIDIGATRWVYVLFVVCILGMLLKQLRLLGETIGIFELAGLACALYFVAFGRGKPSPADEFFTKSMLILTAAFMLGGGVSAVFFPRHLSFRELIATVYVTILMLGWICMLPDDIPRKVAFLRNLIAGYVGLITILGLLTFGGLPSLWFFDLGRLQGLSDNPNQLASICLIGVVLSAVLPAIGRPIRRKDAMAVVVLCFGGALTQSVALIGALMGAALVAATFYVNLPGASMLARVLFGLSARVGTVVAIIVIALFGGEIVDAMQYLYSGGSGKGVVRLGYWMNALSFFPNSPIVGFGPGGHVEIDGTDQLQEAHNIFIDILLSGGVVALLAFVSMLVFLFAAAVKCRQPLILFALLALTGFAMFQTVLRYALFWIALHATIYAALMPQAERATPVAPSRRPATNILPSGNAA